MEASPLYPDCKHARYALEEEDTKMIPSGVPLFRVDNTEADTHTHTKKLNPPTPELLVFLFFFSWGRPAAISCSQRLSASTVHVQRRTRASVSMHLCKVTTEQLGDVERQTLWFDTATKSKCKYICDLNGLCL